MGAYGFLGARNTLVGQHLDLSKWYGFQEVIYKDALDIREITFDFLLGKDSYIVFIFNKNNNTFFGIRVSTSSLFKNLYFVSKDSGEFVNKQELEVTNLRLNSWQHFKIIFGLNTFTLYVNKALIGTFNINLLPNQLFGFRSGKNKVLVDNLVIRLKNSKQVIRETFDKRDINVFLLFLIIIVAINIGLLCYVMFKDTIAHGIVRLIGFNLVAIVASLLLLTFDYFYLSRKYPTWENFKITMPEILKKAEGHYWQNASKEFILRSIRDKYTNRGGQDIFRILFLGGSQVWGAGASEESKTLSSRIETKLNEISHGETKYECINAGVSGFDFNSSFDFYTKELPNLNPKIIVFMLPIDFNLKSDSIAYYNFNKLIQLNHLRNIKTIFLRVSMSIEFNNNNPPLAGILKEFLENNDIRVVDLDEYLIKDYDRGFLWWDITHLTDFGQKLVSTYLFEIICKEIGISY